MSKRILNIGTGFIWAATLLGVSVFSEAEGVRNLDWELMWVIIGGFFLQSLLIHLYTTHKTDDDEQD